MRQSRSLSARLGRRLARSEHVCRSAPRADQHAGTPVYVQVTLPARLLLPCKRLTSPFFLEILAFSRSRKRQSMGGSDGVIFSCRPARPGINGNACFGNVAL